MKAQDLSVALKYFADQNIGLTGTYLEQWFIDRAVATDDLAPARKRLEVELRKGGERGKYLFIGDRGAGKSTELNQLARDLADKFLVVRFSAVRSTGRGHNLKHTDLLLAIVIEVNRQCIEQNWLPTPVLNKPKSWGAALKKWWQERIAGIPVGGSGWQANADLGTILGELQLSMQRTPLTRELMIEQVESRTNEYIQKLNDIARQAEATSQKSLLVIVEDIDKVSDQAATDIFLQYTQMLLAPDIGMIYTFPKALCYLENYGEISRRFPNTFVLPNFVVAYAKNNHSRQIPSGFRAVEQLILQRIEKHLIDPDALKEVVLNSSGVPVWVVRIMKDAIANAVALGKQKVELSDVKAATTIVQRDLLRQLEDNDLNTLQERHKDNTPTKGDKSQTRHLMYIGALIEYENGTQWCDAHRALIPILKRRP